MDRMCTMPDTLKLNVFFTVILSFLFFSVNAQLDLPVSGTSTTIDFENSVTTVNNGTFNGSGFAPMAAVGQLNSNAFQTTGFGDNVAAGGTCTSGDCARGADSDGGVTTGGIYAFDVGGDVFLGVQPAGSDYTPGDITLVVTNNTGGDLQAINLSYELWVNNDQGRSNIFDVYVSSNGVDYFPVADLVYTSTEAADANGFVSQILVADIALPDPVANGSNFYIRWYGDDNSGSGSRDEFGIDDIIVSTSNILVPCDGDAGDSGITFVDQPFQLSASSTNPGYWSGGAGTFSDINDPNATYTPDISEENANVELTWTTGENVYQINRSVGGATAIGTIITDGTIGALSNTNIIDWDIIISDVNYSFELMGPLSGNNSYFSFPVSTGITATETELSFDFSASNAGTSFIHSNVTLDYYVLNTNAPFNPYGPQNSETIYLNSGAGQYTVAFNGPEVFASSNCDAASYTTNVAVFGYPDAEFFYDPAMMCPRDASELPQHTTGTDGIYSYTGAGNLVIDSETGMIEVDDSDIGTYTITNTVSACGNLIITGVIDGPITGGVPKAVELYALADIADLSQYGLGTANNGGGTDGQEFTFPPVSLNAGEYYYVSSVNDNGAQAFEDFFGFPPDASDNTLLINGDDAIELFCNGLAYDVFGEIDVDGTGTAWDHLDGWAYRNGTQDPNGGGFNAANWTFSGINALDGESTNATAAVPMPIGTFIYDGDYMGVADDVQTFDINIDYDDEPFEGMACLDEIYVSIDPATCGAEINYTMLLYGVDDGCYNYDVDIQGVQGNTIYRPGRYRISVTNGYDGNQCWGWVNVEDKVAPEVICPDNVIMPCSEPTDPRSVYQYILENTDVRVNINYDGVDSAAVWGVTVNECSDYHLTFNDRLVKGGCDADTIYRTFRAIDVNGMSGTCIQTIILEQETINDVTLPDDFDCLDNSICEDRIYRYGSVERSPVLECDGAGKVWNTLENGLPSPYDKYDAAGNLVAFGTGTPTGTSCGTIDYGYKDIVIEICNDDCASTYSSYKVVRQWTLIEWCTGEILEHNQIIKVMDTEAPSFKALPDVTISTNLWNCEADYVLPSAPLADNCSEDIHVSWGASNGIIEGGKLILPGKTLYNDTTEVYVYYADCCDNISIDTFKVTVIDQIPPVVVADAHTVVSLSENYEEGLAKIYAETFDDGSWDNCSSVELKIKRMGSTCSGFGEEDDNNKWFDFVHFCCKDVGKEVMVILQVCDDANMDGYYGEDGDNCNTAMVTVEVQDKLPPACYVPANTSITCIEAGSISDLIGKGELRSSEVRRIEALFGEANGAATCSVDIEQELTSDDNCGLGTITRKVTVTNRINGLTNVCYQYIEVTYDEDVNFLTCDDISFPTDSKEYEVFTKYIKANYTKDDVPPYPDQVWCLMNPYNIGDFVDEGVDLPAIEVMDCAGVSITEPIINIDNLCSEVGISLTLDTFDFAGGGCKKILAHWEIIDQCLFVENFNYCDYYEGRDESRYNGDCEINPFVPENGYFEMYVEYDLFDTEAPEITCGEGYTVDCKGTLSDAITASATDNCTAPEFFGWSWKLDENNDGKYEYTGEGNMVTPAMIKEEAFPAGTHRVTWIVSDGCGNSSTMDCILGLEVEDTKAPTPYCHDGLATAVMGTDGTVTLWASDFDAGSYDNCSEVFVSIVPEREVAGLDDFDAYLKSLKRINGVYGWTFDCSYIPNGVSSEIEVRMYATDESENYDYCVATLTLNDNLGGCPDTDGALAAIGGNVSTVYGSMLNDVKVEAMTNRPEYPVVTTTDNGGMYAVYNNPMYHNYEITANKNGSYLESVSTLDLILIQKHILGIQQLDNPYKMIAADINNDGSIKASDLLSLRKLILGYYAEDKLPSVDSWIFVPKAQGFVNEDNPYEYASKLSIGQLDHDEMSADFYGVKVGDVSYTTPGKEATSAVTRSNKVLDLIVNEENIEVGQVSKVHIYAENFNEVYGFQFTLQLSEGVSIVGVENGAIAFTEDNLGVALGNRIGVSYHNGTGVSVENGEVLFTLMVRSDETMPVTEAIGISSDQLTSEAYTGSNLERKPVVINARTQETVVADFELFQNEPNPFKGSTNISFRLPSDGQATLSIYDVTGRVIYKTTKDYVKGLNTLKVDLETNGVLYYQVETADYSATKKMINLN